MYLSNYLHLLCFIQTQILMRKNIYTLIALICLLPISLWGQTSTGLQQQVTEDIIRDINTEKVGQGSVRIMQDETIDDRLAHYNVNTDTSKIIRLSEERINGYKIQVFTGNNQNRSRTEAEYKQGLMRSSFPEHQAMVTYDPPNWRLRVGNFITRQDAEEVMATMKETFPSFGKEMYVVSDVIRRPLNH